MGKKRKDRRQGKNRARPGNPGRPRSTSDESEFDLVREVRVRLREEHPFALLVEASALYDALDPRNRSPFEKKDAALLMREDVIQSFLDADLAETSALLYIIAELTDDELSRTRIRKVLSKRAHPLPGWVTDLDSVSVHRTVEMVHVLGDGDNILLGVHLPEGHELTVVVYIDHNLGRLAKEAFVLSDPVAEIIELMRQEGADEPDTAWRDIDPADARVCITEAVARAAMTYPPFESDTWPACRPLVEWFIRLLPEGGRGYEWPDWDEDALLGLAVRFLESDFAADLRGDRDVPKLLDQILWYGSGYGPCDPLHWSPVAVEILLLDWIPRKLAEPVGYLAKAPEVLRAFIRFCHDERGIRPALTTETQDAVDRWEAEYLERIGSPRHQGPMAILDAMGVPPAHAPEAMVDETYVGPSARTGPYEAWPRGSGEPPPAVVSELAETTVLQRFEVLVDFYGDGRKLTQTGKPTLADARTLVALLGTADEIDRTIGDRTFKTQSAAELHDLMFTIRWAKAAGVLRKEHGKLRATVSWRKLASDPLKRWTKAADCLPRLGPLAGFFEHARYRDPVELLDEVAPYLLGSLAHESLPFDAALDLVCEYADEHYEWLVPYMQEREYRRKWFGRDLDTLVMILGWAGIVAREGVSFEPDRWFPKRERMVAGTLRLTEAGRWWIGAPSRSLPT